MWEIVRKWFNDMIFIFQLHLRSGPEHLSRRAEGDLDGPGGGDAMMKPQIRGCEWGVVMGISWGYQANFMGTSRGSNSWLYLKLANLLATFCGKVEPCRTFTDFTAEYTLHTVDAHHSQPFPDIFSLESFLLLPLASAESFQPSRHPCRASYFGTARRPGSPGICSLWGLMKERLTGYPLVMTNITIKNDHL